MLAQRGPAHPELGRELLLGPEPVARRELLGLQVAPDLAGDLCSLAPGTGRWKLRSARDGEAMSAL